MLDTQWVSVLVLYLSEYECDVMRLDNVDAQDTGTLGFPSPPPLSLPVPPFLSLSLVNKHTLQSTNERYTNSLPKFRRIV